MESRNHPQLHQQGDDEEPQEQPKNQIQDREKHQHKHGEEATENEPKSPTLSKFPLTQKSTQSLPSDPSPVGSPLSSGNSSLSHGFSPPPPTSSSQPSKPPPSATLSRAELTSRDQPTVTTVELEDQTQKLGSGSGKRLRPDLSILRRTKRDRVIKKALLGFRISGFVFCLVSFSVLAADKNQGWALDSFYRYKEFRFCLAVNVIGFAYSGMQAYDLAYQLTSRKPRSHLRRCIDFALDQILAYLLISASSSAAVRIDDWQSNWGKDKFPEMARASMAMSLVAFVALALCSLVSGYHLYTSKSI